MPGDFLRLIPAKGEPCDGEKHRDDTESNEQAFGCIESGGGCIREQWEIPGFGPVEYEAIGCKQSNPDTSEEKGYCAADQSKGDLRNRHRYRR